MILAMGLWRSCQPASGLRSPAIRRTSSLSVPNFA